MVVSVFARVEGHGDQAGCAGAPGTLASLIRIDLSECKVMRR
ncbi:hypothetical protein AF72_08250 [Xylella taiwanensis]|uniref:Uncharacterized protein n=1 Tax=Xylella taiwanensis TaxID=1444770 RepID=Z9JJM9_9GAMM|nr:hypothetical protein AF72_08250 [Xylella taiwanensis]